MLTPPEPLGPEHDCSAFESDEPSLDEWLKRRALKNQESGASRTFVVCEEGKVVGFYAISSGALATSAAPGRFKRNMPDPIPVVVLGRLAVAKTHAGQGLGRALFQDAGKRALHAARGVGIRGMLVHALSEKAKAFYVKLGLLVSPLEPMTLMVTLADLEAALH